MPNSSPPAKTANIAPIGETPTDWPMIFGTSTLSLMRAIPNMMTCTQMTIQRPCGAAHRNGDQLGDQHADDRNRVGDGGDDADDQRELEAHERRGDRDDHAR